MIWRCYVSLHRRYIETMRKNDEKAARYFRSSDRFVRSDSTWWFTTREGDQGPYHSREEAELALRRYVDAQQMAEDLREQREQKQAAQQKRKAPDPTIWQRQIDSI